MPVARMIVNTTSLGLQSLVLESRDIAREGEIGIGVGEFAYRSSY
jgi:hypothetical protein